MYKNEFKNNLKMDNTVEKKETTSEINYFGNWIKTIPVGDYNRLRFEIILKCKITDQIFRHWKCGNSKVPPLAQGVINEIAGRNIFEDGNNDS